MEFQGSFTGQNQKQTRCEGTLNRPGEAPQLHTYWLADMTELWHGLELITFRLDGMLVPPVQ
jgi:hypothetical protein